MRYVKASPGEFLTATDLKGVPPPTASRALARLAERGVLQRARKGLYYVPRETLAGPSSPSQAAIAQQSVGKKARPTGTTAANVLGLSTQVAARPELAVYSTTRPKGAESARIILRGKTTTPELHRQDAALLEFLRQRGKHSEFDAEGTLARVRRLLLDASCARVANGERRTPQESNPTEVSRFAPGTLPNTQGDSTRPKVSRRLWKMASAALAEPPRVRAMLGALLEWSSFPEALFAPLRGSLNPLSRFDFGLFAALPNAKRWQAK
jgi:hypothetical protein